MLKFFSPQPVFVSAFCSFYCLAISAECIVLKLLKVLRSVSCNVSAVLLVNRKIVFYNVYYIFIKQVISTASRLYFWV